VRMSDDALGDFLGRWLSALMDLYQQARSGLSSISPYNPLAMPYAAGNLLARVLNTVPGPWMAPMPPQGSFSPVYADGTATPPEPAPEPAAPDANAAALDSLRRELESIKRTLRGDAASTSPQRNIAAKPEKTVTPPVKKPARGRAAR